MPKRRSPARPPAGPCSSPIPRRLPVLLRRAWYGLNQAFRRRIAHTGCTPDQYIVLRNLEEADDLGLTQAELTRRMSSDPNTMAALISRMERMALLERRRHPTDRRSRQIRLKPLGKSRFKELLVVAKDLQDEVFSGLQSLDQEQFLEDLELVAEQCRLAAGR